MKGLFLKDLYTVWKIGKSILFIDIIFIVAAAINYGNMFYLIYPVIITSMFPMTLMSYEEKEKWNIFADTLPISRKQTVSEKYIFGLFMCLTVLTLVAVSQAICLIRSGKFTVLEWLTLIAVLFAASVFASSVYLPFAFKVGAEKARVLYFVLVGIICGASAFIFVKSDFNFVSHINSKLFIGVLVGISVIVYAVSWMLSVRFYNKREL